MLEKSLNQMVSTPHYNFQRRMARCTKPLPEALQELIEELVDRVFLLKPYQAIDCFWLADRSGCAVFQDPAEDKDSSLLISEGDITIATFIRPYGKDSISSVCPSKEEQVIKTLRVLLRRFVGARKGLHLYQPPYPEPEMLIVEKVEGTDIPRRFISSAWMHWMQDCCYDEGRSFIVGMKIGLVKLFPRDHQNKRAKEVAREDGRPWEFEVFETNKV